MEAPHQNVWFSERKYFLFLLEEWGWNGCRQFPTQTCTFLIFTSVKASLFFKRKRYFLPGDPSVLTISNSLPDKTPTPPPLTALPASKQYQAKAQGSQLQQRNEKENWWGVWKWSVWGVVAQGQAGSNYDKRPVYQNTCWKQASQPNIQWESQPSKQRRYSQPFSIGFMLAI